MVSLSSLRGKVVLLNFWATWCPPCVRELPSLAALHDRLKGDGFEVVAISVDAGGAADVLPYLNRLELTFPVGLDPTARVAGIYGATELPASFLVDAQGRVFAAAKGERDWNSPAAVGYVEEQLRAQPRVTR